MSKEVSHIFHSEGTSFMDFASWRYRYAIPKRELDKMGFHLRCETAPKKDAINVFHKHFVENAAEWIKDGGIFDVCDDYFKKKHGSHYKDMCKKATLVTCPTSKMAERILEETGVLAFIIPDPFDDIDFEECEPIYQDTKSVCWFGHAGNLWTLNNLKLCCSGELVSNFKNTYIKETLSIDSGWKFTEWELGKMNDVFKRHDIVILPYGNSSWQHSKSPNRIMNAIRAGKIVVTNDTPVIDAYELRDYVIVSDDINDGIKWVWANISDALSKVKAGQKFIKSNFHAYSVAKKWAEVFLKYEN